MSEESSKVLPLSIIPQSTNFKCLHALGHARRFIDSNFLINLLVINSGVRYSCVCVGGYGAAVCVGVAGI